MTIEALNILLGAVMPPFIQLLNQYVKNSAWRYVVSAAVCLVVGAVSTHLNGELDLRNALTSGAVVFASASSTYKLFFDNTKTGLKLMAGK